MIVTGDPCGPSCNDPKELRYDPSPDFHCWLARVSDCVDWGTNSNLFCDPFFAIRVSSPRLRRTPSTLSKARCPRRKTKMVELGARFRRGTGHLRPGEVSRER